MASSDSSASMDLKKSLMVSGSKSEIKNPNSVWSTKTPDKSASLSAQSRRRGYMTRFDIEATGAASGQLSSEDPMVKVESSARRQIFSSSKASSRSSPTRLPERFEILGLFFNGLDTAIRLLKLKGSISNFTNISPKIESLTDRRFSYNNLAQMKYIFPEAIEIKRVLKLDETTSCMKPDLHVSLNVDAVEHDSGKFPSKNMGLRMVFQTWLAEFVKAHPECDEIPGDVLPEPFNQSGIVKGFASLQNEPSVSSISESSCLKTSINAADEQLLASASHLTRSVHQGFKISPHEKTVTASDLSRIKSQPVPATTENVSTNSESSLPATPVKKFQFSTEKMASTPVEYASTPARLMSTTPSKKPSKQCLMMSPDDDCTVGSPNKFVWPQIRPARSLNFDLLEDCKDAYDKNNEKSEDELAEEEEPYDGEEVASDEDDDDVTNDDDDEDDDDVTNDDDDVTDDDDDYDDDNDDDGIDDAKVDLSLDVKHGASVDDEEVDERFEANVMEEDGDLAISQAKKRIQMVSGLPKLFSTIHFYFQSKNQTVITKSEILHKIIADHCDIIDRSEVEEQLTLMLQLVPQWISGRKSSAGDVLICINKMSAPEYVRARLEEATKQETVHVG